MLAKASQEFVRRGLKQELFKFGIYLSIPLLASQIYNNPDWSQRFIEYYNYIEYPAEDTETTKLKQDLEDLRQNLEEARRRKLIMNEQLKKLNETGSESASTNETAQSPARWWHVRRWFGAGSNARSE